MDEKRTIDWGSLILGILFVLVSLLSFQDPVGNLVAIVVVFAIFAFIKGIFELFVRNRLKELTGYKRKDALNNRDHRYSSWRLFLIQYWCRSRSIAFCFCSMVYC